MAHGGGREGARRALDRFWHALAGTAMFSPLQRTPFDHMAGGFTMRFDAMHAVTGPYAKRILEETLGAPAGTVVNGVPLMDYAAGNP